MKNACIVGYGSIGPIHALALSKTENADFYAVCDIDPDKIRLCQEQYDVVAFNDFDTMLKDENIDTVHICTPHYLHYEMIIKSLEAGKGVICEKPVTMTYEEYKKLLTHPLAHKVCIVLQNRYNACVIKLKEVTESKMLGDIVAARGILTWCRDNSYYARDEWRGKWDTEGGGVLINQAVHTLDYFNHITGGVKSLKANMMNFALDNYEVEDTFCATLNLKNGKRGVFFATNSYSINPTPEFEITYEKGTIRYADNKLTYNGEILAEDEIMTVGKGYWGTGHLGLFNDYYNNGIYSTPMDVENTMKTMFTMYESAKNNGKEWMEV